MEHSSSAGLPSTSTCGPCGPLIRRMRRCRPRARSSRVEREGAHSSSGRSLRSASASRVARPIRSVGRTVGAGREPFACAGNSTAWTGPTGGLRTSRRRRRAAAVSRCSETTSGVSPSSQPERLSGRGLAPLSGWRATFEPVAPRTSRCPAPGLVAERCQEVAHHHAVDSRPDRERLQLARCSPRARRRAGTAPPGRISRKIAIHLTASHGSMYSRSPNFVPGRGLSRLIGHARRVDPGQLERHLDPLLA